MTAPESDHPLDNPVWSSLTTRHAHLAQGGALARRYPPDISPIAGLPDAGPDNVAALESLVGIGEDAGVAMRPAPVLPPNWEVLQDARITQMVHSERAPLPEGDVEATPLGEADVAEMLALVELTKPGPFRPRTVELGRYIGIREQGRLLAMAGERMWTGDFREVSAVCTHPDAEGRGHARALIGRVVNRMLRAGETPFLHVMSANARAIDVYLRLGFVRRTELPLLHARRVA
jgi:predicted GNAT family acetyltransferase